MNEIDIVFEIFKGKAQSRVMIDVGALNGCSLKNFALCSWTVYAFEPDEHNRLALVSNYGIYDNVIISPCAISDHNENDVPFLTSAVSPGISSLVKFHPSHQVTSKVNVVTLREICQQHSIEEIDLLKVDAEGHDLFVLRGFPWEKIKPTMVICEFEDRKTKNVGYQFDDLARFLLEHKYQVLVSEWYPVVRYGGKHKWKRFKGYPCVLDNPDSWGNIIAFRNPVNEWDFLTAVSLLLQNMIDIKDASSNTNSMYESIRRALSKSLRKLKIGTKQTK
jgi:FkbM family methyltransferase